ncbi:MAG TPA: hypothetical protein VEF06_10980, partial [Bryobacteraceae bacterium]|nr:hypothetical protein [Bryobacteraceae bacterium]
MTRSLNRIALAAGAFLALTSTSFAAESIGPNGQKPVTFAKDVAPMFQEKCEECHHKGTAAPFSVSTYEEARPWARSIRTQVANRNMPPWSIDKSVGIKHFANDRSLSDAQIATIMAWVDQGSQLGDVKDLPKPKVWDDSVHWDTEKLLGPPTFVVKAPDYTMPAVGQDEWYKPMSVLPITEPSWVRAVEIRPSSVETRAILHHVRADLFVADLPNGRGGNDYALMEWAIGK